MNSDKRNSIKIRIKAVSQEVKSLQSEYKSIKMLTKQFNFNDLIPTNIKNNYQVKTCNRFLKKDQHARIVKNNYRQDKENLNNINIQKSLEQKLYKNQIGQNQREESKCLKANIMAQLRQIRMMEKKQLSMRRINQRIRNFNSQQKAYTRNTNKNRSISQNNENSSITCSGTRKQTQISESNLVKSENLSESIKVQIPISQKSMANLQETKVSCHNSSQTLICPKGHQYYEGDLDQNKLPHGHGRIQACCHQAKMAGELSKKHLEYYQGHFVHGKFEGYGTLCYRGGVKYVGEFKAGKRSGRGSLYHNGKAETAKWENDKFISII